MALVIADRVRETTTTTGTGAVTLAGAYTGFQPFSTAIGNANTTYYTIVSVTLGQWEVGIGTYTSSSNTLARDTVLASSSAGSLVAFSAGTKDVFCTQPAERAVYLNANSTLSIPSSVSVGGATAGATLDVASPSGGNASIQCSGINATSQADLYVINDNGFGPDLGVYGSSFAFPESAIGAGNSYLKSNTSQFTFYTDQATGVFTFATGASGTERMRINSAGNVGLGTTTPGVGGTGGLANATLQLYKSGASASMLLQADTAGNTIYAGQTYSATAGNALLVRGYRFRGTVASPTTALSGDSILYEQGAAYDGTASRIVSQIGHVVGTATTTDNVSGYLTFSTRPTGAAAGLTERMRIDDAGNLGLGVTPSTWSVGRAFQFGTVNASLWNDGGYEVRLGSNAVYNSGWKYIATNSATQYLLDNSTHRWLIAASGTGGTALTWTTAMTLDASGNVGIGITPAYKLHIVGGNVFIGGGAGYGIYLNSTSQYVSTDGAGTSLVFGTGAAERMRVDASGNLGLGVTPSTWSYDGNIDLVSLRSIGWKGATGYIGQGVYNNGGWKYANASPVSQLSLDSGTFKFNIAATGVVGNAVTFTQAMTLDASGNLGLGVTPSAWNAGKNIELGKVGNFIYGATGASDITIGANAYQNAGWKYANTTAAGMYDIAGNVHTWYNAPSGTAGNAITFTQAMTLDASGNLGIGTSSPTWLIHGKRDTDGPTISYVENASAGANVTSRFIASNGTNSIGMQITGTGHSTPSIAAVYATGPTLTFQTNGSEKLRIDSTGNVLVTGAGGLGYGTGSGGAVTQITSRTTGVTLNKTNGAITLVSAAGSATYQSFTVTNSTVAATDTIIVNQKSGTDLYIMSVTAVAAGSFRISFATTGGTTTEQPVFNFAVVKAVTA